MIMITIHSRENRDWLYVSRNEGGRGHVSIEDSIDESIQRQEVIKTRNMTDYSDQ